MREWAHSTTYNTVLENKKTYKFEKSIYMYDKQINIGNVRTVLQVGSTMLESVKVIFILQ